jgi:3-dehydroquinate synthase
MNSCVAIKLKVVQSDERDTGLRHILNFGHTLGHAFEAWGEFKSFRHGEAVTLGMVAASYIALRRMILSQTEFDRIAGVCRTIAPASRTIRFEPRAVTPYLVTDKKRVAGRNAWVLPVGIGKVTIVRDVADKDIMAAIGFVREWAIAKH